MHYDSDGERSFYMPNNVDSYAYTGIVQLSNGKRIFVKLKCIFELKVRSKWSLDNNKAFPWCKAHLILNIILRYTIREIAINSLLGLFATILYM